MPRNTITIVRKYADLNDADLIISDEIPSVAAVKRRKLGVGWFTTHLFCKKEACTRYRGYVEEMVGKFWLWRAIASERFLKNTGGEKRPRWLINKSGAASYVFAGAAVMWKGVHLRCRFRNTMQEVMFLKCHYRGYTKKKQWPVLNAEIKALGLGIDLGLWAAQRALPRQTYLKNWMVKPLLPCDDFSKQ